VSALLQINITKGLWKSRIDVIFYAADGTDAAKHTEQKQKQVVIKKNKVSIKIQDATY